jgi:hypothetical protein
MKFTWHCYTCDTDGECQFAFDHWKTALMDLYQAALQAATCKRPLDRYVIVRALVALEYGSGVTQPMVEVDVWFQHDDDPHLDGGMPLQNRA